jgi:succinate dehydrogenase/fumarate reductase flavoprotein subunit
VKTFEELADQVIETDVVIFGGGLAGGMAAIRTKENRDIDVWVVEKSTVRRGGEVAAGLDHYPAIAHPKINGVTAEEYGNMRADDFDGLANRKLSIITAKDALKPVAVLEDIGVKIREDDGTVKMQPGRIGGGFRWREGEKRPPAGDFILYRGADLHFKLADEMERRGVNILERTMLTNLITKDGEVIGGTAFNYRTGKLYVFKAKAVVIATGGAQRIYGYPYGIFPQNLFLSYTCPANHGGGTAAAWRAGAKLVNMEYVYVHTEIKGTPWTSAQGFTTWTTNTKGEILEDKYRELIQKYGRGGFYPNTYYCFAPNMAEAEINRDVLFYDSRHTDELDEGVGHFMDANEGPIMLKILQQRGGLKNTVSEIIPWITGLPRNFSGIWHDENGQTSLKGLFTAGDVAGGLPLYGGTGAFVWGYRIAEYLRTYILDKDKPVFGPEQTSQVQAEKNRVFAPLAHASNGEEPLELEDYVRKVMREYVCVNKVGPKLKRAQELLKIVKGKFVPVLGASNFHELMRAIELQDIIDIAEVHAATSLLRTETRMAPYHYRVDYPEKDDVNWRKNILVHKVDGEIKYIFQVNDPKKVQKS